jgi:omega-amidase
MDELTILLVQPDIAWERTGSNLNHIEQLIEIANFRVDIIILPEMFNTGFSMHIRELAEDASGPTISWMKRMACKYNSLVIGSLIFSENGSFYNRLIIQDPENICLQYNKRHLFSMGNEHVYFTKGSEPAAILKFKNWKIMPLICYDLRFPVWSRNSAGYDLLIYLANWPSGRKAVWDTLLRARAIENQCFVAGVNRAGTDGNNIHYSGGSMLIDPRGIPLAKASTFETMVCQKISLEYLQKFRKKFPVLLDRDEYHLIL